MGEKTDVSALMTALEGVLQLQARDALGATLAAGTLHGPEGVALLPSLRGLATDELHDLERLAARLTSLGGRPKLATESVESPTDWRATLEWLAAGQRETLDSLVEAIPADADDAEGEATEHLLEHVIARKRDALELLERALR